MRYPFLYSKWPTFTSVHVCLYTKVWEASPGDDPTTRESTDPKTASLPFSSLLIGRHFESWQDRYLMLTGLVQQLLHSNWDKFQGLKIKGAKENQADIHTLFLNSLWLNFQYEFTVIFFVCLFLIAFDFSNNLSWAA